MSLVSNLLTEVANSKIINYVIVCLLTDLNSVCFYLEM